MVYRVLCSIIKKNNWLRKSCRNSADLWAFGQIFVILFLNRYWGTYNPIWQHYMNVPDASLAGLPNLTNKNSVGFVKIKSVLQNAVPKAVW